MLLAFDHKKEMADGKATWGENAMEGKERERRKGGREEEEEEEGGVISSRTEKTRERINHVDQDLSRYSCQIHLPLETCPFRSTNKRSSLDFFFSGVTLKSDLRFVGTKNC